MSRVIVLGAGASFGATAHRDVPSPLVSGFFDAADRLGLLHPEFAGLTRTTMEERIKVTGGDIRGAIPDWDERQSDAHLSALLEFVREQFGMPLRQYRGIQVDIERLMGLMEAELLGAHGARRLLGRESTLMGLSADHLEQQLYFVICGVLVKTTSNLACPYHSAIARWLTSDDAVISFNYDQLMDRALLGRGDWSPAGGYMMPFTRIGRRTSHDVTWRSPGQVPSGRPSVPLFKPHGSLNWLIPRDPWETQRNVQLDTNPATTLKRRAVTPRIVYCLESMHVRFEHDFPLLEWWGRYEHETTDYTYDLHSLIVPPTITKAYRDFEPTIGHLWAYMQHELVTRCRELYLVGYSLREGDLRSLWLLRKAAIEGKIERVIVVDPSDDVYRRAGQIFSNHHLERGPRGIVAFAESLG